MLFQSILLLKRNWKLCTYSWRLALTPRGFLSFLEISEGKHFSALAKTYLYTESPSGELGPLETSWRGQLHFSMGNISMFQTQCATFILPSTAAICINRTDMFLGSMRCIHHVFKLRKTRALCCIHHVYKLRKTRALRSIHHVYKLRKTRALRSIHHVCKLRKTRALRTSTICASAERHVHCVASTMCARDKNVSMPHPTHPTPQKP